MELSPDSVLPQRNVRRSGSKDAEITILRYFDSPPSGFFEIPVSGNLRKEASERRKKISVSCSNDASFFLTAVDSLYKSDEEERLDRTPSISCDYIEFHPTFGDEGKYSLGQCRVSSDSSSSIFQRRKPTSPSPAHLTASMKVKDHRFEFSMSTPEKSYVAVTWKSEKAFNWVYTFHSGKRRPGKTTPKESSTVGQMHVSCNMSAKSLITEYVLYATSASEDPNGPHFLGPEFEIAAIAAELPFAKQDARTMNVVVPRGRHSIGGKGSGGPSPLLDRWRCGGACDCGGWDMACSLTVLSDFGHFMELYVVGRKENAPALTVDAVRKGEYSVIFHGEFSALQAFSMCVALLHTMDSVDVIEKFRRQEVTKKLFIGNPPVSPVSRV